MNNIGIMQGRLIPPRGREHVQFNPYGQEISEEFEKISEIGLDYIEWIIPKATPNLFLDDFYSCEATQKLIKYFKVPINAVCLDYLMDMDLSKDENLIFAKKLLTWIANIAYRVDCGLLVIPIYVKNMDFPTIQALLSSVIENFHVRIAFEFLDANSFTGINFINDLNYPNGSNYYRIGCCFDIGNNYNRDVIKEMENYNNYNMLHHIHIKEKDSTGNSVPLGEGVFGGKYWKEIFTFLKSINYSGDFTLQVARGEEGKEVETIKEQLGFVRDLL